MLVLQKDQWYTMYSNVDTLFLLLYAKSFCVSHTDLITATLFACQYSLSQIDNLYLQASIL